MKYYITVIVSGLMSSSVLACADHEKKGKDVFSKLEIKRLDTIRSINGTAVDSPKKAMLLYQKLKQERLMPMDKNKQ